MAEYIEREAAIVDLELYEKQVVKNEYALAIAGCRSHIRKIPAADVKPVVRGEWLSKEYMYGDPDVGIEDMWVERIAEQSDYYAYCSICGKDAGFNGEGSLILSDFCPSCGADMRGHTDEES